DELALRYGSSFPSAHADALAERDGRPVVLDAVALLADVGGTAGDAQDAAVREVRPTPRHGHGTTKHVKASKKPKRVKSGTPKRSTSGKASSPKATSGAHDPR
ncbi:MAG: hypothetical protein RL760_490, partial [Candidatus Eisenbacteria bacterium]